MQILETQGISQTIINFMKDNENLALFAGAGVGVRAGLPSWKGLIEYLAKVAEKFDPETSQLIRHRLNSGHYLNAATIYKTCPLIPVGELYNQLSTPFSKVPHPEKLNALTSLPFSAIFTTNYDRSIHTAYTNVTNSIPLYIELNDPTMKTACFEKSFYIARLHGRAEVPDSIILSEQDFDAIITNNLYTDLVIHALTRYSCMFVGYSFLDPAINNILQVIEQKLSPNYPKPHLAFLSNDSDPKLVENLISKNINTVFYNNEYDHFSLWEGIKVASRGFTVEARRSKPQSTFPLNIIHKFLATSYTQAKMSGILQPLRDVVIDGIIIDLISEYMEEPNYSKVVDSLSIALKLSKEDAEKIVGKRVSHLQLVGTIQVIDSKIKLLISNSNDIYRDISILKEGVLDRLIVRSGINPTLDLDPYIVSAIEEILIARGWDLGASYVGADDYESLDILSTVNASVNKNFSSYGNKTKEKIVLALVDLFQHPNSSESEVLADLGRIAYALQLVLNVPSAAIAHKALLPERVYLDSNVLMPTIVDGHPYHPAYVHALSRLKEACEKAGIDIQTMVDKAFLNEIVAHRNIAIREIEEQKLSDPDILENYISFHGADNVNVFIGAYSSMVGRLKNKISFRQFLSEKAPYENEGQLEKYLSQYDIQTVYFVVPDDYIVQYNKILHSLMDINDEQAEIFRKSRILIEHEASQLVQLNRDFDKGYRSIFVTMDNRLRLKSIGPILGRPGSAVVSHRGFIQLIDMLIGLDADPISITRLLWGSFITDEAFVVINYFTNLALRNQEEAMIMSLSEVLEAFVPRVISAARKERIPLQYFNGSITVSSKQIKFLDRFEDDFYREMAKVIQSREKNSD